ncbi:hypothetical protein CNQ84_14485 [Pseudomonas abyssi]|jgi:hypothetical protein|uniref:Integral membrane protein n=1 Tax=Pseudomonas abyssi TaxID=170540 RepID=A0A2A3MF41_9PSED|nr:hypothetical protein [Pseudomonas abyssi]MAC99116.1 hypothetical protein [Pseudomonadales bacterium]PBK03470.1 hypothetical protein CNQ84_14485 [Pseudomonas abyssi]|tara:strand:+ start:75615 stop:76049 length:435 start_codon:yes stop_codon:yes gene_type:complete
MTYLLLKFAHLSAAAFFVGGVFFEVMILSRAAQSLDDAPRQQLTTALGQRARQVMHWVVLVLYSAGLALAWRYRGVLADPLASHFATLLALKIAVAVIILLHFVGVVVLLRTGRMRPQISRRIHLSVLCHMLLLLFLAKAMVLL